MFVEQGQNWNKKIAGVLFFSFFLLYFSIGWKISTDSNLLKGLWDNYLSFDQGYYVERYFTSNAQPEIVGLFRHPFLHYITQFIAQILSILSVKNIVQGIIFIQCLLSALSIVMMYILCFKISKYNIVALLLAMMYGFSSTLLVTSWTPESFIYASITLVAICFVYYPLIMREKIATKNFHILNIFLAFITAGVTITNSAMWFIASILGYKGMKRKIIWTFIPIILVVAAFVWVMLAYQVPLQEAIGGSTRFTLQQEFSKEYLSSKIGMFIHLLLGSPLILGNISEVPLRAFQDFPQFNLLPSHPLRGWIVIITVYGTILWVIAKNILKDRFVLFLVGCLGFNVLLHGILGFGLPEAFIYGSHIIFILPLLLAYGFKKVNRLKIIMLSILVLIIALNNIDKIIYLYQFAVLKYPV